MEEFLHAAEEVNSGAATPAEISARGILATADTTLHVTAMLEAGRMSLDHNGRAVEILYEDKNDLTSPTGLEIM